MSSLNWSTQAFIEKFISGTREYDNCSMQRKRNFLLIAGFMIFNRFESPFTSASTTGFWKRLFSTGTGICWFRSLIYSYTCSSFILNCIQWSGRSTTHIEKINEPKTFPVEETQRFWNMTLRYENTCRAIFWVEGAVVFAPNSFDMRKSFYGTQTVYSFSRLESVYIDDFDFFLI